ncbi:MAG TPA: DNA-processing protein DprA [Syntrophomonadaceae bacterium]|nr:DNA-processing protein DprA [Syntrophomonadaceae bacterium]
MKAAYGSFHKAWEADSQDLLKLLPDPRQVEAILQARKSVNLNHYGEELSKQPMSLVTWDDPEYPEALKHIAQKPYLLYYRGRLDCLQVLCVAVVGSRRPTAYGRRTAHCLGQDMASRQVTVVSGLARGIDTEAHKGAIEGKGFTAAVLGSGIDVMYPRENRRLFDEVCEEGLVVSEFPPGTPPDARNFPRRNRIISGLSRGVVVVEARSRSGALITADFALEQGRDVFAVPGPIGSENSVGTNRLIQQGAKLITGSEDVLEEYLQVKNVAEPGLRQPQLLMLDRNEEEVLQCIGYEPVHMDDLLAMANMGIGALSTLLLKLELGGLVCSLPGKYYVKN